MKTIEVGLDDQLPVGEWLDITTHEDVSRGVRVFCQDVNPMPTVAIDNSPSQRPWIIPIVISALAIAISTASIIITLVK